MIQVNLCVPEKRLGSYKVNFIQIPGENGDLGIGLNHTDFVTRFRPGIVSFRPGAEGPTFRYFVSEGVLSVVGNVVDVLATYIESSEDIDSDRALRAMERAQKRLEEKSAKLDLVRALKSLERAKARDLLTRMAKESEG